MQELTQTLEISGANIQSPAMDSGVLLQEDALIPVFILVVAVMTIGYWGPRPEILSETIRCVF